MIQRIQTVYLFFALVICGILFFVPISMILPEHLSDDVFKLDIFGIKQYTDMQLSTSENTYLLIALLILVAFITIANIFLFKNRPLQAKLVRLSMLLMLIFCLLIFYYSDIMKESSNLNLNPVYLVGTYLPFLQIILLFLAIRAIKNDEELVRSADRLR